MGKNIVCDCGRKFSLAEAAALPDGRCPRCRLRLPVAPQPDGAPAAPAAPRQGSAEAPPADAPDEATYPWLPSDAVEARAGECDAAGQFSAHPCSCDEFLNGVLKPEAIKWLIPAELRVYPDLVKAQCPPGRRASPLLALPTALLRPFRLVRAMPKAVLRLLLLPVALAAALPTFLLAMPFLLCRELRRGAIARRVRANPRSSYAVRKLYQLADLVPRYWRRGDVAELLRVNARRRYLNRALVLVVQGPPLPYEVPATGKGLLMLLGRLLRARRRVYVLRFENGEREADAAADAMARALGVAVGRAEFHYNHLRKL